MKLLPHSVHKSKAPSQTFKCLQSKILMTESALFILLDGKLFQIHLVWSGSDFSISLQENTWLASKGRFSIKKTTRFREEDYSM